MDLYVYHYKPAHVCVCACVCVLTDASVFVVRLDGSGYMRVDSVRVESRGVRRT